VNDIPATVGATPLWRSPALAIIAPNADATDLGSFQRVSDSQRPPWFRTATAWELDLYRCSVVVSATPPSVPDVLIPGVPFSLPPSTLVGALSEAAVRAILASLGLGERIACQPLAPPYRVRAARLPPVLDGTADFRLAYLYLTRAPGAAPEADRLEVQQTCFWNLAAFSVLEDNALLTLVPLLQGLGDAVQLTAFSLVETLLEGRRARWWSV
jgi:hypothetical protein